MRHGMFGPIVVGIRQSVIWRHSDVVALWCNVIQVLSYGPFVQRLCEFGIERSGTDHRSFNSNTLYINAKRIILFNNCF